VEIPYAMIFTRLITTVSLAANTYQRAIYGSDTYCMMDGLNSRALRSVGPKMLLVFKRLTLR